MPNALEIAKARQIPLSQGLIMALMTDTPFLRSLDTGSSSDTKFLSLSVISLPTAGGFVDYGEGFQTSDGELAVREFDCSLIGGQIKAEIISAAQWDKRHAASGYTWFDLQTMLKMKAQGLLLEKQAIYGTAADATGFPGLKELTPYVSGNVMTLTETAASGGFKKSVINAGGTSAGTAQTVIAIIEGELDTQLILGEDMGGESEIFKLSEILISNEAPNANEPTKKAFHEVQQFSGHLGLRVAGMNQTPGGVVPFQQCVRRIANLTADAGHTLTESLMSRLRRSFGAGRLPTKYVTGTRSGEQLAADMRSNKTVSVIMGQPGDAKAVTFGSYPPPPDNYLGTPIIYADNTVTETEALEA